MSGLLKEAVMLAAHERVMPIHQSDSKPDPTRGKHGQGISSSTNMASRQIASDVHALSSIANLGGLGTCGSGGPVSVFISVCELDVT